MLGFKPDLRDYGIGAQVMVDLGLKKIRFMTNNPKKVAGLEGYGLEITEWVPLPITPNPHNARYLQTKVEKMGHIFNADDLTAEGKVWAQSEQSGPDTSQATDEIQDPEADEIRDPESEI